MCGLTKTLLLAGVLATVPVRCAQQEPEPPASDAFAIENVTVINVETGERSAGQTVLISGNQISAVGPAADVQAPGGARVVDGQGKFLIPGLWDMHVHALRSPRRALPLAVASGHTGVRDMGSTIAQVLETREAIANGLVAPRLILAGEHLNGVSGKLPRSPPEHGAGNTGCGAADGPTIGRSAGGLPESPQWTQSGYLLCHSR